MERGFKINNLTNNFLIGILLLILIFNTITPILAVNNTDSKNNTNSKVFVRQLSPTSMQILQKPSQSKHWNMYLFNRITTKAQGVNGPQDVWRMYKAYNVDLSTKKPLLTTRTLNRIPLTNQGNWEKAVQINNTLLGGVHGFEKHVKLQIYADNKPLNLTPNKMVECQLLSIKEMSNLINPKYPYNTVARTTTTYTYNGKSMYITNNYNWTATVNVTRAYAAMLPVNNNPAISSIGHIHGQKPGNLTGNIIQHVNSPKVTTWNLLNTLHMSIEVMNPTVSLFNYTKNGNNNAGKTWINTAKSYNKIYITLIHTDMGVLIKKGTTWTIQTAYKIWG